MPKAHQPNGVCKRDSAVKGYTPVNDTEWDDMREFLEDTFLPALRKSIGGNNATATRARWYVTNQKTWRTIVELAYKGRRWEGNENGHWVDHHFLLMISRYVKDGLRHGLGLREAYPRSTVAWGAAKNLGVGRGCSGYKEYKIGHPAWDELADRVLAIKRTGHTKPSKFTGRVIEVVFKFHLDFLAMATKVNSQVERLRDLDDSDVDGEEPAESEEITDSDDEPTFFARPLFASGGNKDKQRIRDYCTRMLAKTTAEEFCCATYMPTCTTVVRGTAN
jgi:hypothetical protein